MGRHRERSVAKFLRSTYDSYSCTRNWQPWHAALTLTHPTGPDTRQRMVTAQSLAERPRASLPPGTTTHEMEQSDQPEGELDNAARLGNQDRIDRKGQIREVLI